MKLTLNKWTALHITRYLRSRGTGSFPASRVSLIPPDPAPRKRWSKTAVDLSRFGLSAPSDDCLLDIAVPSKRERLLMRQANNTVYAGESVLPPRSFIEVESGLAISCPELLFIEMASILELPELLMLGFELCGGFSRDSADPLNGPVAYHRKPVTSCAKIAAYLAKVRWVPGARLARRALEYLSNNAWSPTEAVVATMASLPPAEFGYGLGPCVLNERVEASKALASANAKGSRVPDILFGDSKVGINYDGAVHLDLQSIVNAAVEVGRNPGESAPDVALGRAVREVRAKAVDDIKRNRELAAAGYTVFPVVKEDLYEEGALDGLMLQIFDALEKFDGRDMSEHRRMMKIGFVRIRRQELVWSLLGGKHPDRATDRRGEIVYLDEPLLLGEMVIGF